MTTETETPTELLPQSRIFHVALWATGVRVLVLASGIALVFSGRMPPRWGNIYEAAFAPESWIMRKFWPSFPSHAWLSLIIYAALAATLTFTAVWAVFQIMALAARVVGRRTS